MTGAAIVVEDVWKQYRIGSAPRATSLRDEFGALLSRAFRAPEPERHIWALRAVAFEVARGEVIGICGQNGAGKSTLFRILARVTEPTRGRVRLHGRVSALLEVGTGFHGDLTGRENVFLNGALLGMSRRDVAARLDQIVDYAGVGPFLDTPVRHYSSGMQARLGFAVAAHLEQDILILDEVLAVGDATFQRRCMETVSDIARGGKTILLVSHNMLAVEGLCSRALLLEGGTVVDEGPARSIVEKYLTGAGAAPPKRDEEDDGMLVLRSATVAADSAPDRLRGRIEIVADVECRDAVGPVRCGFGIGNSVGQRLATGTTFFARLGPGRQRVTIEVVNPGLPPGDYFLDFALYGDVPARWLKFFGGAARMHIPSTITQDQQMLELQDTYGIVLQVERAAVG